MKPGRRKIPKYIKKIIACPTLKQEERLREVKKLAFQLMEEKNVKHKFMFSYSSKWLGLCSQTHIKISISHALSDSIDKIRNTLLHEIAHALLPSGTGHRKLWQDKAKELGVTLTRTYHL